MSRLVGLYPKPWRDRYEDEFRALMSERPSTARDRLDVVRGALDACLHSQLGRARPVEPTSHRPARPVAGLTLLGGVAWVAAGLAFHGAPIIPDFGYKDSSPAVLLIPLGLASLLVGFAVAVGGLPATAEATRKVR